MGSWSVNQSTPAGQLVITPPSNELWQIEYGYLELITSSTAATRQVSLVLTNSLLTSFTIYLMSTGNVSGTSTLYDAFITPYPNLSSSQVPANATPANQFLFNYAQPPNVWPFNSLQAETEGIIAGDSWTIQIQYNEVAL